MFKNIYSHCYWEPPRYHGCEQMESERTLNDAFSFINCIELHCIRMHTEWNKYHENRVRRHHYSSF